MKRREFIPILGGAVAWPLAVRAQQQVRMRRVGVLVGWEENNPQQKHLLSMLTQWLQELGWTEGSNIRLDVRGAAGNVDRMQVFAKELVGLEPDVILASTTPATAALHRETRTVPIVFLYVSDPVGAGFIANLSRPGANITGINNLEATMGGKWLELLKEIAPSVKRVSRRPVGWIHVCPSCENHFAGNRKQCTCRLGSNTSCGGGWAPHVWTL